MTKKKVAILGGGLGAMSTAFWLTSTAELRDAYEVTVYSQGWRLGGKGASGRNAAEGERIEEHGLHAFLGFYENAFRTVKAAYGEWQKDPKNPFPTWKDAFLPQHQVTFAESPDEAGTWTPWTLTVPTLPGEPGDTLEESADVIEQHLASLLDRLGSEAKKGSHPTLALASRLSSGHAQPHRRSELAELLAELDGALDSIEGELGADVRRLFTLLDIGVSAAKGIVLDVLPGGGYQAIDRWDFKEWLMHHGCSFEHAWSAPVRVLYTLGFAFAEGKQGRDNARASAGVALKVALSLMFAARGAPLFKMRSGMGDTIFTPIYEVLRQRGVKVELFRRVHAITPTADGTNVAAIELGHQVKLLGPSYQPLRPVKVYGDHVLPCWPSEPDWSQIEDGPAIGARLKQEGLTLESAWCDQEVARQTLKLGEDFDLVVLGISIAELPHVAPALATASAPFAQMLARIGTVRTQACQLWLKPSLEALGWKDGTTIMTGYAEPFDTWGDMSHLTGAEAWPEGASPQTIAYFCSPMRDDGPLPPWSDRGFPARELAKVQALASDYAAFRLGMMWPAAVLPSGRGPLDRSLLVSTEGGDGDARFAAQYFRANVDPTERYVLCLPGTTEARLDPGQSGFTNLFLAGDWTRTSMMSGCAEAAIESGMRASQAISGVPAQIHGKW